MKFVLVYARIYAECLKKAFKALGKNAWTIFLPAILSVAFTLTASLLGAIPLIGPFLLGFVFDAALSSYLYFVGEVVANGRVSWSEFGKSLRAYFWSILNLLFVFWILDFVLGPALRANPNAPLIRGLLGIAAFVLLNAVPEVLYQKGTFGGIATIQRTFQFIQENWIEWFIPNLLLGGAAYEAYLFLGEQASNGLGPAAQIAVSAVAGALLHGVMVFRGFLFEVLDGSTHRQRMYRYRAPS